MFREGEEPAQSQGRRNMKPRPFFCSDHMDRQMRVPSPAKVDREQKMSLVLFLRT